MRLIYNVTDRHWDGYRDRWRYRVTIRDASVLNTPKVLSALFKRRLDAASYAGQSELHGPGGGARYLSACGARDGDAYKIEMVHPSGLSLGDGAQDASAKAGSGLNPKGGPA